MIAALLLCCAAISVQIMERTESKPRLVVLTDIAPGNIEPDDMESMVRLMTYTDQVEIEGLITTIGWNCDPYPEEWADSLLRVIDAYEYDLPHLSTKAILWYNI